MNNDMSFKELNKITKSRHVSGKERDRILYLM